MPNRAGAVGPGKVTRDRPRTLADTIGQGPGPRGTGLVGVTAVHDEQRRDGHDDGIDSGSAHASMAAAARLSAYSPR